MSYIDIAKEMFPDITIQECEWLGSINARCEAVGTCLENPEDIAGLVRLFRAFNTGSVSVPLPLEEALISAYVPEAEHLTFDEAAVLARMRDEEAASILEESVE